MTMHSVPAVQRRISDVIAEYVVKRDAIPELIKSYDSLHKQIKTSTCIEGEYSGSPYSYHAHLSAKDCHAVLLKSAWRTIYKGLNIAHVAPAKTRKKFEMFLENPPELTKESIVEHFGDFLIQPRHYILKGLAEAFSGLDPAFKSHSKIKIGVKALPKRMILTNVISDYGMLSYGGEQLRDVINAIRAYEGLPHLETGKFRNSVEHAQKYGKVEIDNGLTLKVFQNGNGHLFFSPEKLLNVNRGIAEFYGEVLPDIHDDGSVTERRASTAVSKDLQYYPTPKKVIDEILHRTYIREGARVLEPSCGDGALMQAVLEKEPSAHVMGIEFHAGRAMQARAKGLSVVIDNFLQVPETEDFDVVLMNPPFYGTHWRKHLDHALKFLKKDEHGRRQGTLICILPATAFYDGHLDDLIDHLPCWSERGWKDLPVGSFSESGTNVPTGYVVL